MTANTKSRTFSDGEPSLSVSLGKLSLPEPLLIIAIGVLTTFLLGTLALAGYAAVGYEPKQPVPFSHALHAASCGWPSVRHSTVESAAFAAIPPTKCLNCHASIKVSGRDSAGSKSLIACRLLRSKSMMYRTLSISITAHINKGVACELSWSNRPDGRGFAGEKVSSMAWCLNATAHLSNTATSRP
jgi:hypothetical protein